MSLTELIFSKISNKKISVYLYTNKLEMQNEHMESDGKREGECKSWYENGQLRERCMYKDGQKEGECKFWYNLEESTQLYDQSMYKNGKKEGEYKRWRKNGQLYVQSMYKDGKREGEYKFWYENEQLAVSATYKNGQLEGEYKEWYENSQLAVSSAYKNGKLHGEYKAGCLSKKYQIRHYFYRNGKRIDLSLSKYKEAARKIWYDGWIPHWYSPYKQKPGFVRVVQKIKNSL